MIALPQWTLDDDGYYVCSDPAQARFALEAASLGVDIVRCDLWLATLPDGPERDYLIDLRVRTQAADFNGDGMMLGLRALLEAHQRIEGRPLMQAGAQAMRLRSRGGKKTAELAKVRGSRRDAELQKAIKELAAVHGTMKNEALAHMLADRCGGSAAYLVKQLPRLLGPKKS